jgi:phosphopantothenate-cysteine ligase
MATGRLGSLTAEAFLREDAAVTYVCSENAALPQYNRAEIIRIGDVQELKSSLEKLMREQNYDAIIHSMAVSDYTVKYSAAIDDLACFLAERLLAEGTDRENKELLSSQIRLALSEYKGSRNTPKISSDIENLFLCLEKTPKIIGLFKKLQPDAVLVGFKLLAGVEEEDLLLAAQKLMARNQCDFVLANDKRQISGDRHAGILIGADGSLLRLSTKQEIADAIVSGVIQKIRERGKR